MTPSIAKLKTSKATDLGRYGCDWWRRTPRNRVSRERVAPHSFGVGEIGEGGLSGHVSEHTAHHPCLMPDLSDGFCKTQCKTRSAGERLGNVGEMVGVDVGNVYGPRRHGGAELIVTVASQPPDDAHSSATPWRET
jgi:hypothetical protein